MKLRPSFPLAALAVLPLVTTATLRAQITSPPPDTTAPPKPAPGNSPQRIVITAQALDDLTAPVEGYRATTSVTATKTPTPLEQVPQSVQVVTRQLIEAQGDVSVTDATRNVSGVTGLQSEREINNAQFRVRGFPADTYFDGLRQYLPYPLLDSLVNIERVEVLKGPSAVLYTGATGAPLGGTVNLVSKSPVLNPFGEVGVRGGSFGTVESFVDVNQPLDPSGKGRVLFRLTGDAARGDDEVDRVDYRRWSVFPTLTLRSEDNRASFTLRGRYSYREQTDYSGLPAVGTVLPASFSIPRQRFIGAADQPDTTSSTGQLTGVGSLRLNDVFTLNLLAGYVASNFNQFSGFAFPGTPLAPGPPVFGFATATLPSDDAEVTVSPSLLAQFNTGPHVRHTVLAGFDYDHTTERADLFFNVGGDTFDVRNPVYPRFATGAAFLRRDTVYDSFGGFLQDQVTVFERLHLLGSVRFTQLDVLDRNRVPGGTTAEFSKFKVTPRGGAVLDLGAGFSVFGDYGEGFQAPLGFSGLTTVKPFESQQYEGGVRWVLPNRLTASVVGFHVARQNDFASDPNNVFLQIQTGEKRSRGLEADALWQATPSLALLVNYAFVDAEITEDTTLPVGARLPRVPRHSGRFYARYDLRDGPFRGLGAGLGVTAGTSRAGDDANTFFTQDFYSVDAQVSFARGPWATRVNVENLTDRRYFEPYQFLSGTVAPNRPVSVFATVAYTFDPPRPPASVPSAPEPSTKK